MIIGSQVIAVLLVSAALSAAPPPLQLRTLSGGRVAERYPVVRMFWRTDCAPCRLELRDLAALRRAAAPLPIQLVGLQPVAEVRRGLRAASLSQDAGLWTAQDPGTVLVAWGGAPARLPLAVALDAQGRPCARRTGLIGADQLRAWAQSCGGRHARH